MSRSATTSNNYRCGSSYQAQLTVTKSTSTYTWISDSFVKGKNSQGIGASLLLRKEFPPLLKIVYPNCCGIDVHKTFVVAVIAITNNQGITEYHRKRFSTFTNGLIQLRGWLEYYSCFDVCMEATGKYWIPVFNILEEQTTVYLAHPKYVKAIRGKKTTRKMRMKLTQLQVGEKNRYQNCLTWSNLQLASVVCDVFGKRAQVIIKSILDKPQDKPNIEQLVHKRMKHKVQDLEIAMEGALTPEQAEKIRVIKAHYDALAICKEDLEQLIRELGQDYQHQVKLIQIIPGFKEDLSALRIISEIGCDMTSLIQLPNCVPGLDLSLPTMKVLGKSFLRAFLKGENT